VLPRLLSTRRLESARARLSAPATDAPAEPSSNEVAGSSALRSRAGWTDAAGYALSDLSMLKRELVIGFVVAGFASALVPNSWWAHLFLTGHGFGSALENAAIGPFLAIISFVCSVGNVPMAAALWQGGIGFGGVISFIFADLITLPLLFIYRRYYGGRITLQLLGCFWLVMSATGLAAQGVLAATRLHVSRHIVTTLHAGVNLDVTSALNILAMIGLAVLVWLRHARTDDGSGPLAKDPVCGMQIEKSHAAAVRINDSQPFYFCSDGCAARFDATASSRSG
jgi:YHS domain-containing protein